MKLVNSIRTFAKNDEGQDLLEYALLIALIAIVSVAAVTAAGSKVAAVFQSIADSIPA